MWAVYTAHPHTYNYDGKEERTAIDLISGGATGDQGNTGFITARQEEFPFGLIAKFLTIKVEEAEASKKEVRRHILNSITGTPLNSEPPKQNTEYEAVNDACKLSSQQ